MYRLLLPLFLFHAALLQGMPLQSGDSLKSEMVSRDLALEPGRVHHFSFRINNGSNLPQPVAAEVILPEGIRTAVPLKVVTLPAGESALRVISITIPRFFLSGAYNMEVLFHNGVADKTFSRHSIYFEVKEVEGLSFELFGKPEFVMGGDRITATYLLKNTGNGKRKFVLETHNCKLETAPSVILDPGEAATVEVSAQTLKYLTSLSTYSFSVQAYLSDDTRKRDFQSVRVYPLKEEAEDLYFRYPVTLSARYLARGREGTYSQGYQLEAFGSGFLDTAKRHNLEFMARGPNNFDLSFLGLYDEYYIAYKNKNLSSFAGSKTYLFTPLTEAARFGYGTELVVSANRGHKAGFIYVEPRFYRDIRSEMAGFAEINIYRNNSAGIYYLSKTNGPTGEDARLVSFLAKLRAAKGTYAELEFSQGTFREESDNAYRINLESRNRFLSFTGHLIHAGSDYPGYYRNTTFYNGNLSLAVTKSLSASVSAREDFSNAALDTLLFEAPYTRMLQSTVSYRVNSTLELRAFYSGYERKDRMPVKRFDYRTESVNLLISQYYNRFTGQIWGELGKTENRLPDDALRVQKNSYRVNLSVGYRPSSLLYIRGFTSYTNINSFIAPDQNNWLWGFSANGQLTRNLRTSMQVQNTYSIEDYYRNRNLFQFSVDYSFLRHHKLSVNSFYTLFQNQTGKPDYSASVTYSVKIGVPLRKTVDAGTLTGFLMDPSGLPMNGLLIFAGGRSAVTRDDGSFEFRNMVPGIYHLSFDRKQMDMHVIPDRPSPLTVEVFSGDITRVSLRMVRAARIRGMVVSGEEGSAQPGGIRKPAARGNIIIDLKEGEETFRVITNDDGSFEFPLVRPGKWIMHIHPESIESGYRVQSESIPVQLQPGETRSVEVVLVPRTRSIIYRTVPGNGAAGGIK